MNLSFLHPVNWSRYSRRFADNKEPYYSYKRVILLSQFTLLGSVVGALHAVEDLIDGLLFLPLMDGILAIFVFACYLLNEKGYHKTARYILLAFLNVFFFVYASLAPRELGIYFYYFTWVGLASVIFEPEENLQRLSFVIISIILLILLFVTDFRAYGNFEIAIQDANRSFLINLVTSMVVLVFFIVYMANMNDTSEKRLSQLAQEVELKNRDLQKTNVELDRFLYSTSHDLRAPLMSVKGLINLMRAEPDLIVSKYLPMVSERVDRLDEFIQDIINYSRNGKTQLRLSEIPLRKTVIEVMDGLKHIDEADKMTFKAHIPEALCIVTDRDRLLIVLNNLISNAIKYQHPRGNSWVKAEALQSAEQVEIVISDNGRGIEAHHLDKIFDMFYRATTYGKGSGLGLYIVKETLEKIGGTITVESEVDKGTRFSIKLPVALSMTEPASEAVALSLRESGQREVAAAARPT